MKQREFDGYQNDPRWVRVPEIARILSVSTRYVYKLIENGELPAIPLGRAICIPQDALRQWMEDKEAQAQEKRRHDGKNH